MKHDMGLLAIWLVIWTFVLWPLFTDDKWSRRTHRRCRRISLCACGLLTLFAIVECLS